MNPLLESGDDDMLKVSQVARMLNMDRKTILDKIHKGEIRATRLKGNKTAWRIRRSDLKEALVTNVPDES